MVVNWDVFGGTSTSELELHLDGSKLERTRSRDAAISALSYKEARLELLPELRLALTTFCKFLYFFKSKGFARAW